MGVVLDEHARSSAAIDRVQHEARKALDVQAANEQQGLSSWFAEVVHIIERNWVLTLFFPKDVLEKLRRLGKGERGDDLESPLVYRPRR